jgi:aminoglycoside 6'-N-acetyltransferase I
MRIRQFEKADWAEWLRMASALFPEHEPAELEADMEALQGRSDAAVFVAERPDGMVCGFVEVGTRPYADGCRTSPVGYVEAWYVDADVRRQGYGRALLRAAEDWARAAGCREIASDAYLHNTVSQRAHEAAGYAEVGRIVQYRKPLG